jgi:cob(I)alamin adenosyltransferase
MDFARLTTKRGDEGVSATYDGRRLVKSNGLFEVVGTVDELSSWLGCIKASIGRQEHEGPIIEHIETVQRDLINIAAEACTARNSKRYATLSPVGRAELEQLEGFEAYFLQQVSIPRALVLPGGSVISSQIDIARSVARRLERRYVAGLEKAERLDNFSLKYLNRLSDYLFVLARYYEKESF